MHSAWQKSRSKIQTAVLMCIQQNINIWCAFTNITSATMVKVPQTSYLGSTLDPTYALISQTSHCEFPKKVFKLYTAVSVRVYCCCTFVCLSLHMSVVQCWVSVSMSVCVSVSMSLCVCRLMTGTVSSVWGWHLLVIRLASQLQLLLQSQSTTISVLCHDQSDHSYMIILTMMMSNFIISEINNN